MMMMMIMITIVIMIIVVILVVVVVIHKKSVKYLNCALEILFTKLLHIGSLSCL